MEKPQAVWTLTWLAHEAALSFIRSSRKRKGPRPVLCDSIDSGALGIHVLISEAPMTDFEIMRQRATRAGRMLSDEAQRKGLNTFGRQPPIGDECAEVRSEKEGMALRATRELSPLMGPIIRLDMIGSRSKRRVTR